MKYLTNRKINVRTIRKLANNEGFTCKNGKIVEYKTGWQVGVRGVECHTAEEASVMLHKGIGCKGCVGVWFSEGIYYVDICMHITTKQDAMALGKLANQQSIYGWAPRKAGQLVWCEK